VPDNELFKGILSDVAKEWIEDWTEETTGSLKSWNQQTIDEFKSIPVETLIRDNYFLGFGDKVYPGVLDDIVELWGLRKKPGVNIHTFIDEEGIGCVGPNTYIYTTEGLKTIKDLYLNKSIIGLYNGEKIDYPSHIIKTHKPTLKIKLRGGFELVCSIVEPIKIMQNNGYSTMEEASRLKVGDYVAVAKGMNLFGSRRILPNFKNNLIELTEDIAYGFGVICGDGGIGENEVSFTQSKIDQECINLLIETFKNFCSSISVKNNHQNPIDNLSYHFIGRGFVRWLKLCGVTGDCYTKEVPWFILEAPKEIQAAFLRGLFTTDGSVDKKGRVRISLANEKLIKQLQLILLNFDIFSLIGTKKCCWGPKGIARIDKKTSVVWRLKINGINAKKFYEFIGFSLKRKQNKSELLKEKFNPNIEVIPHQFKILTKIVDNVKYGDRIGNAVRRFKTIVYGKQNPGRTKLRKFYDQYKFISNVSGELKAIEERLRENCVWLKIEQVEDLGNQEVFDFHIPDSHLFVGNGFVLKNSGKTIKVAVLLWLLWYEASMHLSPQEYYNLHKDSTIAFICLSRSEAQSRRVIFSDVWKRFKSPFNQDYFPSNPRMRREIFISRNNTVVYAGTSSALSALGYNLLGGCFTGDVEIKLGSGEIKTFRELENCGPIVLKGFNEKYFINVNAQNIIKTRENTEVYEVEMEDGSKFKATADQLFMTYRRSRRKGYKFSYKSLDEITDKDEIVSDRGFIKCRIKSKKLLGKEDVFDVVNSETSNFILSNGIVVHNCVDEANFLEVVEDSKRAAESEETYDAAEEMYNAIMNRMASRFMRPDGTLPGLICMCSSPKYPGDFTSRKRREAQKLGLSSGIFWKRRPLWVAKGPKFYQSGEYFYVDTDKLKVIEDPNIIERLNNSKPETEDGIEVYKL